ncbi:MAG: hypothetical protein WBC06_06705 [Chitinophagaceae bacterium]
MKKKLPLFFLILFNLSGAFIYNHAQETKKDTVSVGIYITSIHDIDFKQKEYTITFWLWLKYRNKAFDFQNNLEVPMAKTVERTFFTIDSSSDNIYMQMKLQCIMKDSWRIANFPFDQQKLRLSIENSQFDANSLVFMADTAGQHYDDRFTLRGWSIDSCIINTGTKVYQTAFGAADAKIQKSEYSAYRVRLSIKRDAGGLFWKMFLGMYIAFLISFLCFYIHADGMDSRFGLSVGSIFAVIGNKYIIDSSLPETAAFTLVDILHGMTLISILVVIAANAYSLKLVKRNEIDKAISFDRWTAAILLLVYIILNTWFIWQAYKGA